MVSPTSPAVSLERIRIADWAAVHDWARLPESCRYQVWGPNTEEQTKEFVRAAVDSWDQTPQDYYPYAAHVADEVLGLGELKILSRQHGQGEIAYVVHPRVWGQGVATAIGDELLRIGFTEHRLHRIVATSDPRNVASARVLAKLGMSYEGRLRQVLRLRDGWRDSEVRSILVEEWGAALPGQAQ